MKVYPKQMQVYLTALAKAEKPTTQEQASLNAKMAKACKSANRLASFVRAHPGFTLEKVGGVESVMPVSNNWATSGVAHTDDDGPAIEYHSQNLANAFRVFAGM